MSAACGFALHHDFSIAVPVNLQWPSVTGQSISISMFRKLSAYVHPWRSLALMVPLNGMSFSRVGDGWVVLSLACSGCVVSGCVVPGCVVPGCVVPGCFESAWFRTGSDVRGSRGSGCDAWCLVWLVRVALWLVVVSLFGLGGVVSSLGASRPLVLELLRSSSALEPGQLMPWDTYRLSWPRQVHLALEASVRATRSQRELCALDRPFGHGW